MTLINKKTKTIAKTKTMTMTFRELKKQSQRLVTFDTLITFLTIENNNLNIHSDP